MKKFSYKFLLALSALVLQPVASCDDDDVALADRPSWSVALPYAYAESMTAVLRVPDSVAADETADDCLAAFVGNECRGVGERVIGGDGRTQWHIVVLGHADEQADVRFRYYNQRRRHLYRTRQAVPFVTNTRLGSADAPLAMVLEFE